MDRSTFNQFRRIAYDRCGIALSEGKEALLCARLGKRMRALGIRDPRAYLRHLTSDRSGQEAVHFVDAISTNVTHFFREPEHFRFARDAFAKWLNEGQQRFRFWSAACSSGEEPYSLAMTLLEAMNGQTVDLKILATDISTRVLAQCRDGVYEKGKLKDVPAPLRERYFQPLGKGPEAAFRVDGAVKDLLVIKRLNLATPPFAMRGPLDIIFCRNVMIYFDTEARKRLLDEMHRLLKPGGCLMVGHAESLAGMMSDFKALKPSIYVKQEGERSLAEPTARRRWPPCHRVVRGEAESATANSQGVLQSPGAFPG